MRTSSISLALAFLLAGAVVLAQTHNNSVEKKASDEYTFQSDVRIGSHLLKAGRYEMSCDKMHISFSLITVRAGDRTVTKVLEVPCQGKELPAKRQFTELSLPVAPDGVAVLEKLYLRGSNVEHVFPK